MSNYNKEYHKLNPHIRAWRSTLKESLKRLGNKKEGYTIDLLGYSALELKEHIESIFTNGMSWDNYGDKTDKIFLMLRSSGGVGGNTWNLLAGGIEDGETPLEGLKRETKEETKINPDIIDYKFNNKEFDKDRNLDFHYYKGFTKTQFIAKLDEENVDYGWFGKDELPSPLFPKLIDKINKIWEN